MYGQGTVSTDGTQVVPDPDVVLYEFTGAMLSPLKPPDTGPKPEGCKPGCGGPPAPSGGCSPDPVDCSSGLFLVDHTDLAIEDIIPISVTRAYRQNDTGSYAFGTGWNLSYDYYLATGKNGNYNDLNLILPDGAKVHYIATTPGTGGAAVDHGGLHAH